MSSARRPARRGTERRAVALLLARLDGLQRRDHHGALDVLGAAAAREVVARPAEPLQDGAHRLGACQALGQLVADVARLQAGEHEHVGAAGHRGAWRLRLPDARHDRGVQLQLPVAGQARPALPQQGQGVPDLVHRRVRGGALGAEREQRHARLAVREQRGEVRGGEIRDLGQLLRARADHHGAVCEEKRLPARRHHHEKTAHLGDALLHAYNLHCKPHDVPRGSDCPRHASVGDAAGHQEVGEAQGLGGVRQLLARAPAGELGAECLGLGVLLGGHHVHRAQVHAQLLGQGLHLAPLGRPAHQRDVAEVQRAARRLQRARVRGLWQHDALARRGRRGAPLRFPGRSAGARGAHAAAGPRRVRLQARLCGQQIASAKHVSQ
mmetsp:Transcript_75607/g.214191  ORF Transcript_75607/g.214191 Transcript_75607/m.214191 type:complete len:381 (+) Transcript_75607:87-1229(+)